MSNIPHFALGLSLSLFLFGTGLAQTPKNPQGEAQTLPESETAPRVPHSLPQVLTPLVTATAGNHQVRYVSIGEVKQARLQIFSKDGTQVFDSDFKLGNLIEWQLQDQGGSRVSDGSYLFLVSVRDFSERVTQKYGSATLEQDQVYLEQTGLDGLPEAQAMALEANKHAPVQTAIDRIGAAGFSRTVSSPTSDDKPSTVTQSATTKAPSQSATTVSENISGTGTLNILSKWLDGSGTLGNSSIVENSSGRVGIGTSTPETNLEVQTNSPAPGGLFVGNINSAASAFSELGLYNNLGTGSRAQFYMRSSNYAGADGASSFNIYTNTTAPINIGTNGIPRLRIESNGRVGIGTTTPVTNLEVRANNPGSGGFFVGNSNNTSGAFSEFGLYNDLGPGSRAQFFMRSSTYTGADGANSFNIFTNTTAPINIGTSGLTRLRIDSAGKVGIGTTNPQAKLDVAGAVNVSGDMNVTGNAVVAGNIAAKYQDVAEWVQTRHPIAAGTVVVLDTTQNNAVVPSYLAYDTRLAGVVSAQPGLILGEGGAGKVMVASSGRVKVKVDATRNPIRIGDLLVTSNKPGLAMKSRRIRAGRILFHRPGTIVGKALEPLLKGEGEILVLLGMQ